MKNIYLKISELGEEADHLVLATIISTKGSTPQKAGQSALFNKKGLVYGTVGGGILEGKVQKIAMEVAGSGKTAVHHFELDKDISFKEDAICGGQATVLLDAGIKNYIRLLNVVAETLGSKKPCIISTVYSLSDKGKPLVKRAILSEDLYRNLPVGLHKEINKESERLIKSESGREGFSKINFGKPGEKESGFVILESLFPPLQLIIAGAGHIGKSLSHIGKLLDFEVTVIDDRSEYANAVNLPDADHIITDDIEKAMISVAKTCDTFIVIVTRGHNDDARALKPCIGSEAAYVGMIGSRTKIEKMHRSFVDNGWAAEGQWSAIHAPIGIAINSKTVEEIAVSIAAELVMVRNRN